MTATTERHEIDLHRRVCRVQPDIVEIKPARSAAIVPLFGFLLGVFAFTSIVLWRDQLPFQLMLALMGVALVLVPFSGMGFVYSVYGSNVIIDKNKQTAVWQQGMFGMGVGTEELVPFVKIERIEIEDVSRERQADGVQELAQYELRLLKVSGRRLTLGQVTVPRAIAASGLARAREVAGAVATLVEKPLEEIGIEQPRRRFRKRPQGSTAG
ncbi:MAG: hypothetical protein IIB23_00210 [Chloroflexi bacterium]|nr:hypothetical protein [Chloroflexota bacterium]